MTASRCRVPAQSHQLAATTTDVTSHTPLPPTCFIAVVRRVLMGKVDAECLDANNCLGLCRLTSSNVTNSCEIAFERLYR